MKKSVNKLVWKVSESWEEGCQLNNNPNPDHYPDDVDHDDDIELVDDVDDDENDDEAVCKCCICILNVSVCLVIF